MTRMLSSSTRSRPTRADLAGARMGIHRLVLDARAALAADDWSIGIPECLRLLRQLEDMLDAVAVAFVEDGSTWRTVRSLRDELGGYLLATETLREVGVNSEAVIALLHRGVALADATL